MSDTKGGFLTAENDPRNKELSSSASNREAIKGEKRPVGITQQEWKKERLKGSLCRRKVGPFEADLKCVLMQEEKDLAKCRECGSLEVDWVLGTDFKCLICSQCKEMFPEKYSLPTKTDMEIDYLLAKTDVETDYLLTNKKFIPHRLLGDCLLILYGKKNLRTETYGQAKPAHFALALLFLRYQMEECAFSKKKNFGALPMDWALSTRDGGQKR